MNGRINVRTSLAESRNRDRTTPRLSVALLGLLLSVVRAGFGQRIIYVDADAAGNKNGSLWADAYNHVQDGLGDVNSKKDRIEQEKWDQVYRRGALRSRKGPMLWSGSGFPWPI